MPVLTAAECLRRAQRLANTRGLAARRLLRVYKRGRPNGYRTKALLVGDNVESLQFVLRPRMRTRAPSVQLRLQRSTVGAVKFCNFYIAISGYRDEMLRIPAKRLWKRYFEHNQRRRATIDIPLATQADGADWRRYRI